MFKMTAALRSLLGDHTQYIWSDHDLQGYLDTGLAWWNLLPPETKLSFNDTQLLDNTAVLLAATIHACMDLIINLDESSLYNAKLSVVLTETQHQFYFDLFQQAEEHFEQAKQRKWEITQTRQAVWN